MGRMNSFKNSVKSAMKYLPPPIMNGFRRFRQSMETPLYKKIPLPLPLSLHIDPSNLCNFKCSFCPTGDEQLLKSVNRFKGTMPFELFCSIIDDIQSEVKRTGGMIHTLHLYKDGEPLLNKRIVDMIAYAKQKRIARIVSTTTNGSLLTNEISSGLITSGLDTIRISIEQVSDAEYKKATGTFSDYQGIKEKVAFLFAEKKRQKSPLMIKIKITDNKLSKKEKNRFFRDFRPMCDEISVDALMGWSYSEKKDFTLGYTLKTGMNGFTLLSKKSICPQPFSALAVNPDGAVSVCCVDWAYATIIGNFNHQNFASIWNGNALREFRMMHLSGNKSKLPACAHCHYLQSFPETENLDPHIENLIETIKSGIRNVDNDFIQNTEGIVKTDSLCDMTNNLVKPPNAEISESKK
jgi:radical SAM protein with 4Fe4S-binding SPASM domain